MQALARRVILSFIATPGCGTALVNPVLSGRGDRRKRSAQSGVAWQVESGIDCLVPCGTTGETPTLNHDEWLRVIDVQLSRSSPDASRSSPAQLQLDAGGCSQRQGSGGATRRQRHPHRVALLQQTNAGRPVPPLPRHRRSGRQTGHRL